MPIMLQIMLIIIGVGGMLMAICDAADVDLVGTILYKSEFHRSASWTQTRGKTYLMKKIKRIHQRALAETNYPEENIFIKLFRRAAPTIWGLPLTLSKPEYAKEQEQLARMFQYALSVIEKYPLYSNAQAHFLGQCLCAVSECYLSDGKHELKPYNISFNGYTIDAIERHDDTVDFHLTDTTNNKQWKTDNKQYWRLSPSSFERTRLTLQRLWTPATYMSINTSSDPFQAAHARIHF